MDWKHAFTGAARGFQTYRIVCRENLPAQRCIKDTLFSFVTGMIDLDNKVVSNWSWENLITQEEYEALMQDEKR